MHLIVVGSGVAGLTAALEAVDAGHDVTLFTKSDLAQSNTRYAQGGVAVVMTSEDTVGRARPRHPGRRGRPERRGHASRCCAAKGPAAIRELIERGVQFDRHDGELAHGLEAAHSHARILHAGGDATGAGIAYALIDRLRESAVEVRERTTVVDLVLEDGRVRRRPAARRHRAPRRRRRARDRRRRPALPVHDEPRGRHRRRSRHGPARRRDRGRPGVLPVPPDVPGRSGQLPGLRGGPRRGRRADRRGRPPVHDRRPSGRRARSARRRRPRHRRADGPSEGQARPARRHRTRRGVPGAAVPEHRRGQPRAGVRLGRAADPGHAGGALLHGRHPHRRVGTHLRARALRRRRGRVQRAARRQPAGLQLTARRGGLRHPGRRGARAAGHAGRLRRRLDRAARGRRSATPHRTTTPSRSPATTSSSSCGTPPGSRATATTSRGRPPGSRHGAHRRSATPSRPRTPTCWSSPGPWWRARGTEGVARRALPHRLPRARSRPGPPLRRIRRR